MVVSNEIDPVCIGLSRTGVDFQSLVEVVSRFQVVLGIVVVDGFVTNSKVKIRVSHFDFLGK